MKPATVTIKIERSGKLYALRSVLKDTATPEEVRYACERLGRAASMTIQYLEVSGKDDIEEAREALDSLSFEEVMVGLAGWEKR